MTFFNPVEEHEQPGADGGNVCLSWRMLVLGMLLWSLSTSGSGFPKSHSFLCVWMRWALARVVNGEHNGQIMTWERERWVVTHTHTHYQRKPSPCLSLSLPVLIVNRTWLRTATCSWSSRSSSRCCVYERAQTRRIYGVYTGPDWHRALDWFVLALVAEGHGFSILWTHTPWVWTCWVALFACCV